MLKKILIIFICTYQLLEANIVFGLPIENGNYKTSKMLLKSSYLNSYNFNLKYSNYQIIYTNKKMISKVEQKYAKFLPDYEIPKEFHYNVDILENNRTDYINFILTNISTLDISERGLQEAKLYSNIVPIHKDLANAWLKLNTFVEYIIINNKNNDNYIIINGVYHEKNNYISNLNIPTHFYKILINVRTKENLVWFVPNIKMNEIEIVKRKVNIDFIENKTNINFFPQMPESDLYENKIFNGFI